MSTDCTARGEIQNAPQQYVLSSTFFELPCSRNLCNNKRFLYVCCPYGYQRSFLFDRCSRIGNKKTLHFSYNQLAFGSFWHCLSEEIFISFLFLFDIGWAQVSAAGWVLASARGESWNNQVCIYDVTWAKAALCCWVIGNSLDRSWDHGPQSFTSTWTQIEGVIRSPRP